MNRRSLLKWVTRIIGWTAALIVAIPGISYVTAPLRRRGSSQAVVQRVARLTSLVVGEPVQMAIIGDRQDAWIHYPSETIGRVWLIRRTDESTPPAQSQVEAFSSVCPHLGCAIQYGTAAKQFTCPCHKAFFDLAGAPLSDEELGFKNPTPRGLDVLQCQIVRDEPTQEWWVEVKYEKFVYGLTTQVPKA